MPRRPPSRPPANTLRIIGGQWRGRRLTFPDRPGLRPSPDRVRETLFNWLAPVIKGARCLDLFAGSGALGLEALSRGAGLAVLVDSDRQAAAQLTAHLELLHARDRAQVVQADALSWLGGPNPTGAPFDIVFLDPPYRQGLLPACCERLEAPGWLAAGAHIYLEAEAELGEPALPDHWRLARSKRAGQVGYHLAVRSEEWGVKGCSLRASPFTPDRF